MDIKTQDREGVQVVMVAGDIDGRASPQLERAIMPLLREAAAVVLDLGRTAYMSSAGLRILLLIYREARERRTRLALAGVRREIQEVMASTGFLGFFVLRETIEEAISVVAWAAASEISTTGARKS